MEQHAADLSKEIADLITSIGIRRSSSQYLVAVERLSEGQTATIGHRSAIGARRWLHDGYTIPTIIGHQKNFDTMLKELHKAEQVQTPGGKTSLNVCLVTFKTGSETKTGSDAVSETLFHSEEVRMRVRVDAGCIKMKLTPIKEYDPPSQHDGEHFAALPDQIVKKLAKEPRRTDPAQSPVNLLLLQHVIKVQDAKRYARSLLQQLMGANSHKTYLCIIDCSKSPCIFGPNTEHATRILQVLEPVDEGSHTPRKGARNNSRLSSGDGKQIKLVSEVVKSEKLHVSDDHIELPLPPKDRQHYGIAKILTMIQHALPLVDIPVYKVSVVVMWMGNRSGDQRRVLPAPDAGDSLPVEWQWPRRISEIIAVGMEREHVRTLGNDTNVEVRRCIRLVRDHKAVAGAKRKAERAAKKSRKEEVLKKVDEAVERSASTCEGRPTTDSRYSLLQALWTDRQVAEINASPEELTDALKTLERLPEAPSRACKVDDTVEHGGWILVSQKGEWLRAKVNSAILECLAANGRPGLTEEDLFQLLKTNVLTFAGGKNAKLQTLKYGVAFLRDGGSICKQGGRWALK